jgi:hypothetical protein
MKRLIITAGASLVVIVLMVILLQSQALVGIFGDKPTLINFFISVFTATYVILTAFVLLEMRAADERDRRPYVSVNIEFVKRMAWLRIENTGKAPAKTVKITILPDITTAAGTRLSETILKNPIKFLPPGMVIRSVLNSSPEFLKEGNPGSYTIQTSYNWGVRNKTIADPEYSISVDYAYKQLEIAEKDISDLCKEMENLRKSLEKRHV